jgi:hypothetical protein
MMPEVHSGSPPREDEPKATPAVVLRSLQSYPWNDLDQVHVSPGAKRFSLKVSIHPLVWATVAEP